jgi:phospholipid/cholesterol/gamma-HCH transport system ATP-binding protein
MSASANGSAGGRANQPKIALRGVCKTFAGQVVLDGLDLEIGAGESVVVIGCSGVGKSVMLKCLLGLLRPDAGSVTIDGEALAGSRTAREGAMRKVGMLFQNAALFDSLPVWENVAFGLIQAQGMARRKARGIAIETLAQVGLGEESADLYPAALSGGMRKRVGLARAIATRPEIILFDEPTTGLDPIMADVINDLIVACTHELGATALTITHDMRSARKIADRIAMLHEGRIVWSGAVADIDASGNEFVDQFIHGRASGPIRMAVRG